jgi:acetyl esterase/lipase
VIAIRRFALRAGAVTGALAAVFAACPGWASAASTPERLHQNVVYAQAAHGRPLTADVYSPTAEAGPAPVVIMIHGGGFTDGDKKGTDQYAAAMASVGFVTVNVNYTLAKPGHSGYLEQVQEIQHAVQWSIAHASQFGGDPHRLALVGFSAGGYLAAMAGPLASGLPGRPVKAVVTLSAPLDLPALDQLFRTRLAECGYQPTCPQLPQSPQLPAFRSLFGYLGCPAGNCSARLIRSASPSSHVGAKDPAFLMFNSADELIPRSQPTDMAKLLRAARVPEQVVIVHGNRHGESYLPDVSATVLKFLGQQLGLPRVQQDPSIPAPPSSKSPTVLIVCCVLVVAAGVGVVLLAARRRMRDTGDGTEMSADFKDSADSRPSAW